MPELRKCPLGHDYWWPAARWQHEACFAKVVADKPHSGGRQPKVVADKPPMVADKSRKSDRHADADIRKVYEKWRKRRKRNPQKASDQAVALMKSIAATIKEMH